MSIEATLAIGTFIALFAAWVIIPSFVHKKHSSKAEIEDEQ